MKRVARLPFKKWPGGLLRVVCGKLPVFFLALRKQKR
jgi:hypothetical protein